IVTAPASTGITAMSRNAVISQLHTNTGIFSRSMPGARMLRMVAMMLIAPMIELMPMRWIEKIMNATLTPPCRDSGGYIVQPPCGPPPGMKISEISRKNANGRIQNDQLFMRGRAMSGAPIIIGIIQFARPTNAGMIAPKIMIRPCIVVISLNSSGRSNCSPGWNNSVRISIAIVPPTKNIVSEKIRYSVPMSLWLVVNSQRCRKPCGLSSWTDASWMAAASWAMVWNLWENVDASALRLGDRHRGGGGGRGRRGFGLLRGKPLLELGLGYGMNHDRHEAVVLAAQFGALAAIHARRADLGPPAVDDARDRVLLPTQARHPPRVIHVIGGDHEAHLDPDRQDQRMVDIEQVIRIFAVLQAVRIEARANLAHTVGFRIEARDEVHARGLVVVLEVLVTPLPLVAGDLDRHVRLGDIGHIDQQVGRGPRHHDR